MRKTIRTTIEKDGADDSSALAVIDGGAAGMELAITTNLHGLAPVTLMGWLKAAVPAYMRSRAQLAKEAIAIGVGLIVIRDHSPRGTLTKVLPHLALGRSTRTLERCMAAAARFLKACGYISIETHNKLKAAPEVAGMFQGEFNFSDVPAGSMLALINEHVGDKTLTQLADEMEAEVLEDDGGGHPMPESKGGGRKKLSAAQKQRQNFAAAFEQFKKVWLGGREHLFNRDSMAVELWLRKAAEEIAQENKQRVKAEKGAGGK